MFEKNTLEGKFGIITGGTSGIGFAIAQFLIGLGAKISVTGRNEEKLAEAVEKLGPNSFGLAGDVRKSSDVNRNLEEHMAQFGRVDFLCNNAAGNFLCPLSEMSENAFKAVNDIVAMGSFLWSKAVYPHMCEQKQGCIINTGTTYAQSQAAYVGHSGAAKAAVLNLSRTMAVEWGPQGIRTNVIAPGPIEGTEGVQRLMGGEKMREKMFAMMPTPRMGQGWEIGAMVAFLLSDLGSYINGAYIPVDGGLHLAVPGLIPAGIKIPMPVTTA